MTFHCWTYRNENNEWCVTEKKPGSSNIVMEETRLTSVNDKNKVDEYKHLLIVLEQHKQELQDFYQDFKKDDDVGLNFTFAELVGCDIETVELLESLIQIQLKDIDVDQQRTPGNKDKKTVWEEV